MKKNIISIIVIILILAAMAAAIWIADKLFYIRDGENVVTQESYSANGIESVSVSLGVGYIELIERSDSDTFTVSTVGTESGFYTVSTDGGVLSVTSEELPWYDRELFKTADQYGITIGVPASFDGEMSVRTDAGAVTVTALTVKELNVSADVGNVNIADVCIPVLDLYADVGNITVTNADTDSAVLKIDVGSATFTEAVSDTLLSSLSVTVDVGDINVSVCGEREGYTVTAHTDAGACNVEDGGDGIPLELSVDVGNIDVRFGG